MYNVSNMLHKTICPANQYDLQEMPLIVDILLEYNPRCCEILRLRKKDIYNNKLVILPGAKNSQNVVIRDKVLVNRIIQLAKERSDAIFLHTSYIQVYRHFRKFYSHLSDQIARKKNRAVTHAPRYLAVNTIVDDGALKSVLHHNSKKSNKYYFNKIKGDHHGTNS
jgi:hypothetical protein